MKPKIILRADGNTLIGYGHVYRLLALADMLKDEFEITFIGSAPDEHLSKVINAYVHKLIDLPTYTQYVPPAAKMQEDEMPFDLAKYLTGNEIVVLDGYWFGPEYQKNVKKTGAKLVCIDDFAEGYFYADAVINHAPGLDITQYHGEPYTRFYLGLEYALLRKVFFQPFKASRQPHALLISMGGTDHYSLTPKILDAVIQLNQFDPINILTSSSFSASLIDTLKQKQEIKKGIIIHKNLSADSIVALLDSCSHSIVSASTILMECYCRGINSAAGYYTANQTKFYNGFVADGMAFGLGNFNNLSPDEMLLQIEKSLTNKKVVTLKHPLDSPRQLNNIFEKLNHSKA